MARRHKSHTRWLGIDITKHLDVRPATDADLKAAFGPAGHGITHRQPVVALVPITFLKELEMFMAVVEQAAIWQSPRQKKIIDIRIAARRYRQRLMYGTS